MDEIDQTQDYSIIFYSNKSDSPLERAMKGLKKKHFELNIYRLTGATKFSSKPEGLMIKRIHDSYSEEFTGNYLSLKEIEKFILHSEYPDFSFYNERTQHWIEKEKLPAFIYFYDSQTSTQENQELNLVKQISKEFKDTVLFVLVKKNDKTFSILKELNGVENEVFGLIVSPSDTFHKKYLLKKNTDKLSGEKLRKFIEGFKQKSLPRFLTSEKNDPKTKYFGNVEVKL